MSGEYFIANISVDSLEWTKHWLDTHRCDLLMFALASKADVTPRVKIVAVESKSREGGSPVSVNPDTEPFREGIQQVRETLDALHSVLCPDDAGDLYADLKLASLFEHLTSETLSQMHPIEANESAKLEVLKTLSALSKRELSCERDIAMRGLVAVTQRDTAVPTRSASVEVGGARPWQVGLVACGTPALRELFEEAALTELLPPGAASPAEPVTREPVPEMSSASEGQEETPALTDELRELVTQLETACRLRGFEVQPIDVRHVVEGPTLVVVPVELRAGASLRPIESASEDIARELGAPAVSVENDPIRPYFIRFLVPRKDRIYPPLPDDPPLFTDPGKSHYLGVYVGANVEGTPCRSFVSEWPHLLVAGTTGSGKTTLLRAILLQLDRTGSDDVRVAIVDGKGEYDYVGSVRDSRFVKQFPEVLLGHEHAVAVLQWLVEEEIDTRRGLLREYMQSHPEAARSPRHAYIAAREAGAPFPIAPLTVVIDEFAEIMLGAGDQARTFEDLVQRVVQAGRSALVHLVLATQRPDANVLRGTIKANLPARIALMLPSHHDSMTVLGGKGAEELIGSGDMVFQTSTGQKLRLQGYKP